MAKFTVDGMERSVATVNWIFSRINVNYSPMVWWLSFGGLLGLIRDKGFLKDENGNVKETEDLDIGIKYEDVDDTQIMSGFQKFDYTLKKKIVNDTNGNPLYYGFTHKEYCDVCVFCFRKHGNFRYHTFDVNHEGKEIPSEYVFSGVPAESFDKTISFHWKEIGREVNLPYKYGTVLDWWYPNWLVKREGCSASPKQIKMKSCKEWKNIKE